MTDWTAEVDRLLFDGEAVEETVDLDPDRLVVTTHRVLAFTPERDGPNFAYADRPNVEGVAVVGEGATPHLVRGVKGAVLGLFLLGMGAAFNLDGAMSTADVDAAAASQTGVGDVLGFLDVLGAALALVNDALLLAGTAVTAFGLLFLGLYARSRHRDLVVGVAGGDDLRLDGANADDAVLEALRGALGLE